MIELLAVMGIVVLLLAVTVPAIRSLSANKLSNAGRLFSNSLTLARSQAIDQRVLMQVRVVTTAWNTSGADDPAAHYRKFSLWQHKAPPSAGAVTDPDPYTQVSEWETLPEGILFEPGPQPPGANDPYSFAALNPAPDAYFLDPSKVSLTKAALAIPGGTMDAACIEFTPTGALNLNSTNQISSLYFLLVPGTLPNGGAGPTYIPAHHPNWFMVQVTPLTGRIQIVRP